MDLGKSDDGEKSEASDVFDKVKDPQLLQLVYEGRFPTKPIRTIEN